MAQQLKEQAAARAIHLFEEAHHPVRREVGEAGIEQEALAALRSAWVRTRAPASGPGLPSLALGFCFEVSGITQTNACLALRSGGHVLDADDGTIRAVRPSIGLIAIPVIRVFDLSAAAFFAVADQQPGGKTVGFGFDEQVADNFHLLSVARLQFNDLSEQDLRGPGLGTALTDGQAAQQALVASEECQPGEKPILDAGPGGQRELGRPGHEVIAGPFAQRPQECSNRKQVEPGLALDLFDVVLLAAKPGGVQRLGAHAVAQREVKVILAGIGEGTAQDLQHLRQGVTHIDGKSQQSAHRVQQDYDRIGDLVAGVPVGLHQLRPLEVKEQRHCFFGQLRLLQRFEKEREEQRSFLLGVNISLKAQLLLPFLFLDVVTMDLVQHLIEQFDEVSADRGGITRFGRHPDTRLRLAVGAAYLFGHGAREDLAAHFLATVTSMPAR